MSKGDDSLAADPDGWAQAAQRHFDPADGELTTAIVEVIAEAAGVRPLDLQTPLYECVDAPAIEDAFFSPDAAGGSRQGEGTVEFRYTDYLVRVRNDGWIRVYEPAGTEGPAGAEEPSRH